MTAIVLIISVLVSLLFLAFAFVQKSEADKQRQLAEEMVALAQKNRMMSEQAMMVAQEARKAEEALRRELEACQAK